MNTGSGAPDAVVRELTFDIQDGERFSGVGTEDADSSAAEQVHRLSVSPMDETFAAGARCKESPGHSALSSTFVGNTSIEHCSSAPSSDCRGCSGTGVDVLGKPYVCSQGHRVQSPSKEDDWALPELSCRIDSIAREMKRSVEHEFLLAQRALLSRHYASEEALRVKAEAHSQEQQGAIESLQSHKDVVCKRLDAKQRQLKISMSLIHRVRHSLSAKFALVQALRAWRSAAEATKEDHLNCVLWAKSWLWRLTARLFASWRQDAHLVWKDRVVAHERMAADSMRAKLFDQMERDKERMTADLERMQAQLAEEQRQRIVLQENLKRVFMRGVCALNFEAMNLLSDGCSADFGASNALSSNAMAPELLTLGGGATMPVTAIGVAGIATSLAPAEVAGSAMENRPVAPVAPQAILPVTSLPQPDTFDWARFEAERVGPTPAPAFSERLQHVHEAATVAAAGVAPAFLQPLSPRRASTRPDASPLPAAAQSVHSSQESPWQPPVPLRASASPPPAAGQSLSSSQEGSWQPPVPLPFVSYTGPTDPGDAHQTMFSTPPPPPPRNPSSSTKGQRWQPAAPPGAAGSLGTGGAEAHAGNSGASCVRLSQGDRGSAVLRRSHGAKLGEQ